MFSIDLTDFSLGDVVSVTTLGQRVVILNSLQAATDLLEKRSSIYSDRPRFTLVAESVYSDAVYIFVAHRTAGWASIWP